MDKTVYFIYSANQFKRNETLAKKINGKYTPTKVLVSGKWKDATAMVTDLNNVADSDYKLVLSGQMSEITYRSGGIR